MRNLSTAMKSSPHIATRESLLTATRIQHRKKLKKIKSKPIKGCRPCAHADPSQQLHSWATAKNSSPNLPGLRHTFLRHEPIVSLPLPSKAVKLLLFKNFYFLILLFSTSPKTVSKIQLGSGTQRPNFSHRGLMLWSSRQCQNSVKLVEYTVRVSWELENFLVMWKNTHQAAIMLHHRMGGSNNRNLFSCSSEGWKFKIRVLTVLVSLEASLLDSEMPASSCVLIQPSPCMHVLLLAILGLKFLLIRPSVRTSLVHQSGLPWYCSG